LVVDGLDSEIIPKSAPNETFSANNEQNGNIHRPYESMIDIMNL
jgi:hypothetical protein